MSGFIPIEGGLAAVKTGFDLIKGVRESLKKEKVDANEVTSQLLELQQMLLDARDALTQAQEEMETLQKTLADNSSLAELEKLMVYDQSVYWKLTGNGDERESEPYCTVCWERDRRLSHLRPGATRGTFRCQIDGTTYNTSEYKPQVIQARTPRY
ncbi:MAG TPA: hypothetical protein VGQ49_13350 [Bryobacteraceae bacterium]|jgi:hypothetical protein|nr:hypothetical protein [Bryobacteraceae bacterium]